MKFINNMKFSSTQHPIGVTWVESRLKSAVTPLIIQQFVQADNKENIKAP